MKEFKTVDDVLDFAMNAEQEAVDFYNNLAENAQNEEMQKIFNQFAQEEISHKTKIRKIKEEGSYEISKEKLRDLKVSDYMVNVKPTADMNYQDALVLAMNKEKAAFRLYMDLADKAQDEKMQQLFLNLAQEESRHKLRFELEYDEYVLREN
ncbi:MAG TPA: ferritin family protein [Bacteroidales bacterium]|nr:ferritin family protein [Bacteroidales bacterium]